jgi:hypothetical protein
MLMMVSFRNGDHDEQFEKKKKRADMILHAVQEEHVHASL